MTTQFLQAELANLVQEAKRKNSDLRNAADKALQELKSINVAGDVEAGNLSSRPGLLSPFLMACGTRNSKFSTIGISCLQRLIISKALAKSRLREVLEAFREAANLGMCVDVQLKILQALPPLLQNYAADLQGPLLGEALMVCAVLQGSKTSVVNNTAAATLSQIVISIFDKIVTEDEKALEVPTVGEAPSASGNIPIRAAALDAYRVFYDICLLTEGQKAMYHRFNSLPQPFGLELIESVLTNHPDIFLSHPEQAHILQTRVAPLVIKSLSDKLNFPTTVRITRILYILLRRHLSILTKECEVSLRILIHMLEQDASQPWKRALGMEVFKGVFHEPALIRKIYSQFDGKEGGKPIIRELMGALTRLSTEKPSIIGLGSQSTAASLSQQLQSNQMSSDQVAIEAGGVAGIIGTVGVDTTMTGIGSWSIIRVPCIDQLDKSEPPAIPESYIYYLTLVCINSFSDGLAKFIIPLAAGSDTSKRRSKLIRDNGAPAGSDSEVGGLSTPVPDRVPSPAKGLRRKLTVRSLRVPINPLSLDSHPLYSEILTSSAIVETCWPAILAACSTFLNATMENELYHALVRSFQKFAHVAGLLRLTTPRDAFLTTLGKSAVPSNILSANVTSHPQSLPTPTESISSIAKGYLGVEGSTSSTGGGDHHAVSSLNVRHLRCLRALLNLGIALGPTLESSWTIILETLQQADFVLYASTKRGSRQQSSAGVQRIDSLKPNDPTNLMANIGSELTVVESAANKMFECTREFPDESFVDILKALCKLFHPDDEKATNRRISVDQARSMSPKPGPSTPNKRLSTSGGISAVAQLIGDNAFALAKIGEVALINMGRLIGPDAKSSGWTLLVDHLVTVIGARAISNTLRYKAAEVLNEIVVGAAKAVTPESVEDVGVIQRRALKALKDGIEHGHTLGELDSATKATEVEIHHAGLEGLNAILEHSGQSLVDGWDIAFDIIDSVFDSSQTWKRGRSLQLMATPEDTEIEARPSRSVRLIRSSFSSLELICSDFLASLPTSCVLVLIDALFAFCSQKDDLNISLTTITFFWNVSDFLQTRDDQEAATKGDELTAQAKNEMDLLAIVERKDVDPHSALWMLLLLRLTGLSTDHRAEVRNGSIQTLFRIFDTYGDQLGPQGWSSCLEIVVFKMMKMDPKDMAVSISEKAERKQWDDTIKLVLGGIGTLYSNYLDVFSQQTSFRNTWIVFVRYLETLLSWRSHEVSTSVFDVLSRVLEKVESPQKISTESTQDVWTLWSSQSVKLVSDNIERTGNGTQETLTSYINSFKSIYALLQPTLTVDTVRQTLEIIKECILFPDAPPYFRDIDTLTPLQNAALEVIQLIRTDIPDVPSLLLSRLADISAIAYTHTFDSTVTGRVPTCIALSAKVMEIMQDIVTKHIHNPEIYLSSAITHVFTALEIPINLKYAFLPPPKRPGQWVFATNAVLGIARLVIPAIETIPDVTKEIKGAIWKALVTIIAAIIRADGNEPVETSTLEKDETFDIDSFTEMRKLMIPRLGQEAVADDTILRYVKAVFWTSMLYGNDILEGVERDDDDQVWLKPRPLGKTTELALERRKRMAYVCIDELFSLVAAASGTDGEEVRRLAEVAAPWLIRRVGMVLGSFVADQPLRGLIPQPVAQRNEMLYLLQAAVKLESGLHTVQINGTLFPFIPMFLEANMAEDAPCIPPSSKRHLFKLFPLLTRCVLVAQSDQALLILLSKALDEMGGALNIR
ncbi:hypothetical protein EX30DRAFT_308428 [Ascodesmis nigricans]|uniref:Endosomal peripheral membrane protein n=1 Tax=Ascodesmis nigricans TaxID=341454 RepID=A0A4S2MT87_9PEZI|nr:hypothetical protein EX30DRAFT_308428 [Ascodesmis nigricans]